MCEKLKRGSLKKLFHTSSAEVQIQVALFQRLHSEDNNRGREKIHVGKGVSRAAPRQKSKTMSKLHP